MCLGSRNETGHQVALLIPVICDLQRSVAPFSQHYLAWSHEFMIATVPQADPLAGCGGAPLSCRRSHQSRGISQLPQRQRRDHDRSGTQAATTIPVGKMPSGLAVDAGVYTPPAWPTARQHCDRHRHQNRCTDRYFSRGENPSRHRRLRQAHRCRQQHRSWNRIGHRTALMMPPTAKRGPHDER